MVTYREANQVKLALKQKYINYAWFKSIRIEQQNNEFELIIVTYKIDNSIKKIISPIINGVSIKTELFKNH